MAIDKRLKNVQQADLTESRVNDDFVYWLKTWGYWLLMTLLIVTAGGMTWNWWHQRQLQERDNAWAELGSAALPEALVEIAQKHQGRDSVALFAELTAADRYRDALLTGKRFDRDPSAPDALITPELRTQWLQEADRLYASVAQAAANSTSLGERMFHIGALFGRAAIAEDQGNIKAAEAFLQQVKPIAQAAGYEGLVALVDTRIANLGQLQTQIAFAPRAISSVPGALTPVNPAAGNDLLTPGLQPDGSHVQKLPGATLKLTPSDSIVPVGTDPLLPPPGPLVPPASTPPAPAQP